MDWLSTLSPVVLYIGAIAAPLTFILLIAYAVAIKAGFNDFLRSEGQHAELSVQRKQGLLDQSQSRPILGRDGGRGPAGGRLLMPRRRGLLRHSGLMMVWLLVGFCILIFIWLLALGLTEFLILVVLATGYLLLRAAESSLLALWGARHRVEVAPCPPAIGDLIRIWVGNRRSHRQEAVMVRVYLMEQVLTRVGGFSAWTEEIIWDEPMYLAELALQSPWRSQFVVRLPKELPGTYLAPGYRLEWMVEVRDDQVDISYVLPVVS